MAIQHGGKAPQKDSHCNGDDGRVFGPPLDAAIKHGLDEKTLDQHAEDKDGGHRDGQDSGNFPL